MNILICSAGRRVKLVEYFKKELNKVNGKVIAIDCDSSASALYHADFFEIVPRIDHPEYLHQIKEICRKYKICGVLSLIDPELELLARYKEDFEKEGICVIGSNVETVELCFDKYSTYKFLDENDIPTVKTYLTKEEMIEEIYKKEIDFPVLVKPRKGSASIGIFIIHSMNQLEEWSNHSQDIIFQPIITGGEYGVDCYIDLISKEPTNIFMKKKISMRAGETDKSISIKDPELKQVIEKLIRVLNPAGPIDIDCFKADNGYIISEINPRFGGGYPHAYELGQNFIKNIINNLNGEANKLDKGNYREGAMMVKFDQLMIL